MEDGFGDGDRVPFGPLYSWFFIMNYISTPLKLVEQHDVSNWKTFTPPKFNITPKKWWERKTILSYWEGNFSGAMLNFGKVFKRKTQTPKTERLGNLVADAFHLHGFSPNPAPGPASRSLLTFESFPCVFEVAKRLLFRHVSGMVDEHTGGGKLGWYLFPATKNTREWRKRAQEKLARSGAQVFVCS